MICPKYSIFFSDGLIISAVFATNGVIHPVGESVADMLAFHYINSLLLLLLLSSPYNSTRQFLVSHLSAVILERATSFKNRMPVMAAW